MLNLLEKSIVSKHYKNMSGLENKRQHFLPQCYLKGFSKDQKSLHVYSKVHRRKNSLQAISRTAYRNFFYKVNEKYKGTSEGDDFDLNFLEKNFFDEKIEKLFAPLLTKINQDVLRWLVDRKAVEVLSEKDRDIFAAMIAIQYLRMPNIREKYCSWHEKAERARMELTKSFFISQFPEHEKFFESITLQYDRDYDSIQHWKIYGDQKFIDTLQDHILNKIWIFYVSVQDDFYTSDNPILVKPHFEGKPFRYEGFGMEGGEVIFPIGSSVLLTLWDKVHFMEKVHLDNQFIAIDQRSKREYNCYQYIWANQEVYSKTNDFKLIDDLKFVNDGREIFQEKSKILVNGK